MSDLTAKIQKLHPESGADQIEALLPHAKASRSVLAEKARPLELEAAQLRKWGRALHQKFVRNELLKLFDKPEAEIDLFSAAMLVAKLDNEEVDIDAYRAELNRMAADLAGSLPEKADDPAKLTAAIKREIILRMFRNLMAVSTHHEGDEGPFRYLEMTLALAPDAAPEHMRRALLLLQNGDGTAAEEDLKWLLQQQPSGIDLERVEELYRSL